MPVYARGEKPAPLPGGQNLRRQCRPCSAVHWVVQVCPSVWIGELQMHALWSRRHTFTRPPTHLTHTHAHARTHTHTNTYTELNRTSMRRAVWAMYIPSVFAFPFSTTCHIHTPTRAHIHRRCKAPHAPIRIHTPHMRAHTRSRHPMRPHTETTQTLHIHRAEPQQHAACRLGHVHPQCLRVRLLSRHMPARAVAVCAERVCI